MKVAKYLIPIIFLVVSILLMVSGRVLKKIYNGDDIPKTLDEVTIDIKDEKWDNALSKINKVREIFNKVNRTIQFSVELNKLMEFKLNLALLEGYIVAQDDENSIAIIYILKTYWHELGK